MNAKEKLVADAMLWMLKENMRMAKALRGGLNALNEHRFDASVESSLRSIAQVNEISEAAMKETTTVDG